MKNFQFNGITILIAFLTFIFLMTTFSCRSKKDSLNLKLDTKIENLKNDSTNSKVNSSIELSKTDFSSFDFTRLIDKDFDFNVVNYDTSKPIDSITGKPPILSEIRGIMKEKTNERNLVNLDKELSVKEDKLQEEEKKSQEITNVNKNLDKISDTKTDNRLIQGHEWVYIGLSTISFLLIIFLILYKKFVQN